MQKFTSNNSGVGYSLLWRVRIQISVQSFTLAILFSWSFLKPGASPRSNSTPMMLRPGAYLLRLFYIGFFIHWFFYLMGFYPLVFYLLGFLSMGFYLLHFLCAQQPWCLSAKQRVVFSSLLYSVSTYYIYCHGSADPQLLCCSSYILFSWLCQNQGRWDFPVCYLAASVLRGRPEFLLWWRCVSYHLLPRVSSYPTMPRVIYPSLMFSCFTKSRAVAGDYYSNVVW